MALLSCTRKHRALLLARAHYHRTQRRERLMLWPIAASAMAVSIHSQSTAASADAVVVTPARVRSSATKEIEASHPTKASAVGDAEKRSPFRAFLMTLYTMLLPQRPRQMDVENDFLDDLKVCSVPSHLSDVIQSKDSALFWRYDMDSYAANRHNEDRTQYVSDTIRQATTGEVWPVFFCACYDGHGGEEAVEFVQKRLYGNIRHHLEAGKVAVNEAIMKGFMDTDHEFHRVSRRKFEQGMWSACSVGACAVIALVFQNKLYVASCGDCRAVMAFRESDGKLSVEQITLDHSANEAYEQKRLRNLHSDDKDIVREIGVNNFYVKGRLQPTRSLGDTYMKCKDVNRSPMPRGLRIRGSFQRPYISAVPDVFEVDLKDRRPEFLVLGSDGLYGEMSNEDIVRLVSHYRESGVANTSMALRAAVLERVAKYYGVSKKDIEQMRPGERRNYHDDITIDVLHFSPPGRVAQTATAA